MEEEQLPLNDAFISEDANKKLLSNDGEVKPPSKWYIPKRFILVGLCFVGMIICYADRTNFSVSIIPMRKEFNWDKTTEGFILSAFWYGYAITQVPGGWLSDRFSGKTVLSFGVISWSAATMLTPPAAKGGLASLILIRLLLGMGEGVAFPAIHSMLAKWIPPLERSRAVAFVISATYIGTILPLASAPKIVLTIGWPPVFYIFGALGFAWYFPWQYFAAGTPDNHTTIHRHEYLHIKEKIGPSEVDKKKLTIPWKKILKTPAVWAIIINQFCGSYAFYTLLSWLPTYFDDNYDISLEDLSIYAVLPYIVQGICGILSGILADFLLHRNFSVTFVRKLLQSAGLLLPAVFYALLAFLPKPPVAVGTLLMSAALGAGTLTLAGVSVNHLDIAPTYSGIIFAMGNTAGTLAGIVGTTLSGSIVQVTSSWEWVFGSMVVMSLIGTVAWLTMAKGVPIKEIEGEDAA